MGDCLDKFELIGLPCGCLHDAAGSQRVHEAVVECPWCGATFLVEELRAWAAGHGGERQYFFLAEGTLVTVGDRVYEVVDRCQNCSALIGRARSGARAHLREFRVLRN